MCAGTSGTMRALWGKIVLHLRHRRHLDMELSKLYSRSFNCCRPTRSDHFNLQGSLIHCLEVNRSFPDIYACRIMPNFHVHSHHIMYWGCNLAAFVGVA